MKICPECKTTNVIDDDHYCYRDGVRLAEMVTCQWCGRELLPKIDVFCARCGRPVELECVPKP